MSNFEANLALIGAIFLVFFAILLLVKVAFIFFSNTIFSTYILNTKKYNSKKFFKLKKPKKRHRFLITSISSKFIFQALIVAF
jgi:hypothetical protein